MEKNVSVENFRNLVTSIVVIPAKKKHFLTLRLYKALKEKIKWA